MTCFLPDSILCMTRRARTISARMLRKAPDTVCAELIYQIDKNVVCRLGIRQKKVQIFNMVFHPAYRRATCRQY